MTWLPSLLGVCCIEYPQYAECPRWSWYKTSWVLLHTRSWDSASILDKDSNLSSGLSLSLLHITTRLPTRGRHEQGRPTNYAMAQLRHYIWEDSAWSDLRYLHILYCYWTTLIRHCNFHCHAPKSFHQRVWLRMFDNKCDEFNVTKSIFLVYGDVDPILSHNCLSLEHQHMLFLRD